MTTCQLIENLKMQQNKRETELFINTLSHGERRAIRSQLNNVLLPRNLFYDYDLQVWIKSE